FLPHNRHPAKLFLGDVGSIPIGFLMGYTLLSLAGAGHIAAALILPAYYIADSGLTIVLRALRKEKLTEAHSEHAYQKAVRAGRSHGEVVMDIVALNIVLVPLAAASTMNQVTALASLVTAYGLDFALIYNFRRPARVMDHG